MVGLELEPPTPLTLTMYLRTTELSGHMTYSSAQMTYSSVPIAYCFN